MNYDAVIIGAGASGLACAVELSSSGKKILLLEKQPSPGGLATTFNRKGFLFESALHCVDGLQEGGEIRNFLKERGIDKKITFIGLKNFSRIIYPEHDFVSGFDRDDFVNYLKQSFPSEEKGIEGLFKEFDKFYLQFDGFQNSGLPLALKLFLLPFIYSKIIKMSLISAEKLIGKYIKDIKLKGLITNIWNFIGLPPQRLSAFYYLVVFRGYHCLATSYIQGSSKQLFQAMAGKIEENGSTVKFNTRAVRIVTGDGKAVRAVVTDQGEIFKAKAVISNANPIDTFGKLMDNAAVKETNLKKLAGLEKSISAFQVYLGLRVPAGKLGMGQPMFSLNAGYDHNDNFGRSLSGDYENCSLALVDHAQIDPSLAPEGKGTLLVMALDSYANWEGLSPRDYKLKKEDVARRLIKRCEKYLPGLAENIEVMEVATPKTMERYGSSPEGAIYGFAQTPEQSVSRRPAIETKVKGLFLAGAWTRPGAGIHACFVSGIDAARLALKFLK